MAVDQTILSRDCFRDVDLRRTQDRRYGLVWIYGLPWYAYINDGVVQALEIQSGAGYLRIREVRAGFSISIHESRLEPAKLKSTCQAEPAPIYETELLCEALFYALELTRPAVRLAGRTWYIDESNGTRWYSRLGAKDFAVIDRRSSWEGFLPCRELWLSVNHRLELATGRFDPEAERYTVPTLEEAAAHALGLCDKLAELLACRDTPG